MAKEFIVETFDDFNIRGPELRLIVRAVCGNNFKKVLALSKLLYASLENILIFPTKKSNII